MTPTQTPPKQALTQLCTDPVSFLKKHIVWIDAPNTTGLGYQWFGIHHTVTMGEKAGEFHPSFRFSAVSIGMAEPTYLMAHTVQQKPHTPETNLQQLSAYHVLGGSNVLLLGELKGSSIAALSVVGQLFVAHLSGSEQASEALQMKRELTQKGRFYGHIARPLTRVFGKGDYQYTAQVIGIRMGRTWEVYAQCLTVAGKNYRIAKVVRVV